MGRPSTLMMISPAFIPAFVRRSVGGDGIDQHTVFKAVDPSHGRRKIFLESDADRTSNDLVFYPDEVVVNLNDGYFDGMAKPIP